jgi:hypothetical protein
MTITVWVLLLFAAWTVVLLSERVGYFRLSRIPAGRGTILECRPEKTKGRIGTGVHFILEKEQAVWQPERGGHYRISKYGSPQRLVSAHCAPSGSGDERVDHA